MIEQPPCGMLIPRHPDDPIQAHMQGHENSVFAMPLIESNQRVLSLLDALDAAEADFARVVYLGNMVRSRTTEEQDELSGLVRKVAR